MHDDGESQEEAERPELMLVDPPVGPFSSPKEIQAWILELEALPQIPYVSESLEEAKRWLLWSEEQNNSADPRGADSPSD